MDFNERHIRLFYRLLNHKHGTELRFIKRGSFPAFSIAKTEEEFVQACRQWNGKRNIYAGLRDRVPGLKKCATAGEIIGIQTIALDLDPIREAEIPSTEEELKNTIAVSELLVNWFQNSGFNPPYRAATGNGVCLYFSVPFYEINDENRQETAFRLERFEAIVRRTFKEELVKHRVRLDSMYDLPRIAKVIGTLSVKGESTEERPWRLSHWIEEPEERRVDEKLLHFILQEEKGNPEGKNPFPVGRTTAAKKERTVPEFTWRIEEKEKSLGPVWLMQPIPYFGEKLEGDWIYEPKIDGWRMQVVKTEKGVEFWGRRLERKPNWTDKLKAVPVSALDNLPSGTILDTELSTLKGRRFIPSLFTSSAKAEPVVYVFDVIYFRWEFMGNLPLSRRKEVLSSLKLKEPFSLLECHKVSDLEKHLREEVVKNHEGIVIKELNSPYLLGKDAPMATANWRKIKPR